VANSIIDDMLKDQIPDGDSKKKKSPKLLIIFIILLIIAIIVAAVVIMLMKKKNEITPKMAFLECLSRSNLSAVLDFDSYNSLEEKMKNESSHSESKITITSDSSFSEMEDIEISVDADNDAQNKKSYADALVKYANKDLIQLEMLTSEDAVAITSSEIVSKYVGSKYENLGTVLANISDEYSEYASMLSTLDLKNLSTSSITMPKISSDVFKKYIDIIGKNVEDASFSSKTVTLNKDSGAIDVTEYSMSIPETKMFSLVDQLLQTFKEDDELISSLVGPLKEAGIDEELVKMSIESLIASLYEEDMDDSRIYSLKVYDYNGQTVKLTFDLATELSIDFEYEYGDKENSVLITMLSPDTNAGLTIKLKKAKVDVSEKMEVVVSLISEGNVVGEVVLTSDLINSESSYEVKNKITANVLMVNLEANVNTKIDFTNVEVEDITEENCLMLDTLDSEEFNTIVDSITIRTNEILNTKLNLLSTDGNVVVEQPTGEENQITREEAQSKIIENISAAMTEQCIRLSIALYLVMVI